MKSKLIIFFIAAIVFLFFFSSRKSSPLQITVKDIPVNVTLADTDPKRQRGLSGTPKLEPNEGMLFVFDKKSHQIFWMKDMLIPLDMIWIADNKIVNITKNIPIPASGTPDNQLTLYPSGEPVEYILEVNAGFSDTHQLQVGDSVDLSKIKK